MLAVALSLLAGPGCLIEPTASDCAAADACDACLALGGCGWCAATGACVRGNALGDESGVCEASQWHFAGCASSGSCATASTCSECRSLGCGWCLEGAGECLSGDVTGPASAERCAIDQWVFGPTAECVEARCWRAPDCATCRARGCEWCAAGGFCQTRADSACLDPDYELDGDDGAACPENDSCHLAGACGECVARPGCAYCYHLDISDEVVGGCYPEHQCPRSADFGVTDAGGCP